MRKLPPRSAQAGFTLIEIIIVVGIIAAIMAFVATQTFGGADRANVRLAGTQLEAMAAKVEQYRMDTGQLPSSLDNLVTSPGVPGWLGPYLRRADDLNDPWRNPIELRMPGASGPFEVTSYGADGKPGGESTAADIVRP